MKAVNSELEQIDSLLDFEQLIKTAGSLKIQPAKTNQRWKYDPLTTQRASSDVESPIVKLLAKGFANLKCDLSSLK